MFGISFSIEFGFYRSKKKPPLKFKWSNSANKAKSETIMSEKAKWLLDKLSSASGDTLVYAMSEITFNRIEVGQVVKELNENHLTVYSEVRNAFFEKIEEEFGSENFNVQLVEHILK